MKSTKSAVFFIALILIQYNGSYADCNENYSQKQSKGFWNSLKETVSEASKNELLVSGLKIAAASTAVIAAAPVVVGAAGFGAAGIAAGSVAATVQATWFGGAISGLTGTAFAGLQSVGAMGALGAGAKAAVVAATGAAVKTYEYISEPSEESESCSKNNNKLC